MVFLSIDPMMAERASLSTYNYVQNNPIMRIDPTGALDSPIFDQEGNFLGTDSEGYTGEIIVMNANTYNGLTNNGEFVLDHENVMNLTTNGVFANDLDNANLTLEGLSKVLTHVTLQMEGEKVDGEAIKFDRLEGGIINIIDTGNDDEGFLANVGVFGEPSNPPVNAAAAAVVKKSGMINVTARTISGESARTTVEGIQSTFGIHEYFGHGVRGLGMGREHAKVYQLQANHKRTISKMPKQLRSTIIERSKQ